MSDTPTQNRLRETLLTADGVGKIGKAKALAQLIASETDKLTRELAAANAALADWKVEREGMMKQVEVGKNLTRTHYEAANRYMAENDTLRADLATRTQTEAGLREKLAMFDDPNVLHAHCLRNLSPDRIAHLFGDKMQGELAGLREQVRVLKHELGDLVYAVQRDGVAGGHRCATAIITAELALIFTPEAIAGDAAKSNDLLRNLLALIHRDGGHYTEQHGLEKSCADAEAKVSEFRVVEVGATEIKK